MTKMSNSSAASAPRNESTISQEFNFAEGQSLATLTPQIACLLVVTGISGELANSAGLSMRDPHFISARG